MTEFYNPQEITRMIYEIEKLGIETSLQSTYFRNEVCVHLYGNNERAAIMSIDQFMNWAPNYTATSIEKQENANG